MEWKLKWQSHGISIFVLCPLRNKNRGLWSWSSLQTHATKEIWNQNLHFAGVKKQITQRLYTIIFRGKRKPLCFHYLSCQLFGKSALFAICVFMFVAKLGGQLGSLAALLLHRLFSKVLELVSYLCFSFSSSCNHVCQRWHYQEHHVGCSSARNDQRGLCFLQYWALQQLIIW